MNATLRSTLIATAIGALSTFALASGDHDKHAQSKPADSVVMTEGEVRKIDRDAGKVTIKHGEIKNLDMPPMTMVFRVKEPAMLDKVKDGDKVRFTADKVGGNFTVTQLEAVK